MSNKLEEEFIKELEKAYRKAGKAIEGRIKTSLKRLSESGNLNLLEARKGDRLKKLLKNINTELKIVNQVKVNSVKTYLANVYKLNYFGMGWALETEGQIKLSYAVLNRRAVANSMLSPLDKIALKNNAYVAREGIKRTITQSIIKGDSIPMMARGVKKSLRSNANNAVSIARTETTRIMGESRLDSMKHAAKTGLAMRKEWVSTSDDRTRESHIDLDGERVAMDKPFSNGLQHPGDQSTGDAGETVNCRCTMVTEIADYPNPESERLAQGGKVIEKQSLEKWYNDRVEGS
jgi:SPP1 gp7 family putative phage head morphogenesis protein